MKRGARIAAAAAAAFIIVLTVQFPARWAAHALPHNVACTELDGTVWNGSCAGFTLAGTPLGDLTWRLHPLALLIGRLRGAIELTAPNTRLRATVEIAPGKSGRAQNLNATLPLDHRLLAQLPPSEHAIVEANLPELAWHRARLTAVTGAIELHGLTFPNGEPLGDYRVSFPAAAAGEPVGRIEDLGGPLSVAGTLRLTSPPGFALQALVAPRPGAPADVTQGLRYLGSPDAQGRREFSFESTF